VRRAIRTKGATLATPGTTRHAANFDARRAPRVLTREELTRHLLALVLAAVLAWYTFVVPSNAHANVARTRSDDDAENGGEVRFNSSEVAVDELDWPEYIYLD